MKTMPMRSQVSRSRQSLPVDGDDGGMSSSGHVTRAIKALCVIEYRVGWRSSRPLSRGSARRWFPGTARSEVSVVAQVLASARCACGR